MVGWHHRHDRPEFEQALGVGDGQGSLACCSPWGHKESDMSEGTEHAHKGITYSVQSLPRSVVSDPL